MTKRKKSEFDKALELVMNTPEGLVILKTLHTQYVETTSLSQDIHTTMYHLGQKELVLGLLKALHDVRQLDNVILNQHEEVDQRERNAFGEPI